MAFSGSIQRNRAEFQMQHLRIVKEIHQDILALPPPWTFLCSFSPTPGAVTLRQVGEHEGGKVKWRIDGVFNREKENLRQKMESPCHLFCLYQCPSSGRRKMVGKAKENLSEVSSFETAHQVCFLRGCSCIQPEAVSSCCLATCSSSPSSFAVTSVAYMGPALEAFGLGFRYYSFTCDNTCCFLGHSSSNISEKELILAKLIVVGATFNSYWDQFVALILGHSLMACR